MGLVEAVTARTNQKRILDLRAACQGMPTLDARLEAWMVELLTERSRELHAAIERYGSPLNLVSVEPFNRNINDLNRVAADRDLDFQVFFARKANKCLAFVDAANGVGAGIDVASEAECRQVVDRSVDGTNVICTAAIKTKEICELCASRGVTIAIDNLDEMHRVEEVATSFCTPAKVAIRVSGFQHLGSKLYSRFGFDINEVAQFAQRQLNGLNPNNLRLSGLHFHLDGYDGTQRASAIRQCLPLIDYLRSRGHGIRFLDIGGGMPMNYLASEEQWNAFCAAHRESLLGKRPPIFYKQQGLGYIKVGEHLYGQMNTYQFCQSPIRHEWLANVLDSESGEGGSIAESLSRRLLQLRCEPGRSVLDGCGITVARVEFTKRHHSGDWFIGLNMNHTQCRTSSDDFLVDPIVVHCRDSGASDDRESVAGFLVGSYCTESALILLRRLHFPTGIGAGDLVVLPNTAGYFMHFLESRSHQFPLAKNLVVDGSCPVYFHPDDIDSLEVSEPPRQHSI